MADSETRPKIEEINKISRRKRIKKYQSNCKVVVLKMPTNAYKKNLIKM